MSLPNRRTSRTRSGILFLLTFSSTVTWLTCQAGYPELGPLKDKLLYFERHKDDYDVVFVGSSRVQRGIVPPLFDEEAASRGWPVRSFNFGIAGMKPHEANATIRRVLETRPARLRWVVVELGEWDPVLRRENRFKRRGIFWHDAAETFSAARSTWLLDAPWTRRADLLLAHSLHFAARSLAVGRGPEAVRSLSGASDSAPSNLRTLPWQGFEPWDEASYRFHPVRRQFLRKLDEYRERVERTCAGEHDSGPRPSYNVAAVRAQVALVRRAGAEPVHFVPPVPRATPELDRLHGEGSVPVLLPFNRPRLYPDLFAADRRFDAEHLTQAGAEAFTRLLASRFLAEIIRPGSGQDRPR